MKKQLLIVVSREFGSGGHEVAAALAHAFNLPLYDKNILEPIAAADQWEMGNGWTDAGGYENSAVTNTTDTGAAPLFWKESIDASAGVIIDFDFEAKVEAMQTTAELVLRRTDNHAKYMRMVITARGPIEYIV